MLVDRPGAFFLREPVIVVPRGVRVAAKVTGIYNNISWFEAWFAHVEKSIAQKSVEYA